MSNIQNPTQTRNVYFIFFLIIFLVMIMILILFEDETRKLLNNKIEEVHILPTYGKFTKVKYNKKHKLIVPNIVHFLRFNQTEFSFLEASCILSVVRNQLPQNIYIHTNLQNFTGKYWDYLLENKQFKDIYNIKHVSIPVTIFQQYFDQNYPLYHGSDITRLRILRQYGGIFLDNDSYLVKNMDKFRKMEMSVGWDPDNQNIGTQILVANPDARFIQLWIESYRGHYKPELWYYNAGDRPYQTVLIHKPDLIYNATITEFGVENLSYELFNTYISRWKNYFAIHLLERHRNYLDHKYYKKIPVLDEINVCLLKNTLGEMLRAAYYGSTKCPGDIMKIARQQKYLLRKKSLTKKNRKNRTK